MGRCERLSLDRLEELSIAELRDEWARCHGAPPPNLSADLLRHGIAHRIQERRHGGISRETRRIIMQTSRSATMGNEPAASPPQRKLTPGTRLVRDWHGAGHTVTVLEQGFEYDGQVWRSLTAVAKAITGTHRNGPRFFGLTQ
ncbi:hypothetical protein MACH24_08370 [Erythrobacter sp. Dej080120_24]|uniref:DUF2924 domain-containing protein n=1 Tax=Erythrobacter sp. Dej080120_24 TaxID=3024837 RepID=UPI00291E45D5|nr:hypothetical protein MACH24_08370 [Erythrobacter sp. Dej080120_24]